MVTTAILRTSDRLGGSSGQHNARRLRQTQTKFVLLQIAGPLRLDLRFATPSLMLS